MAWAEGGDTDGNVKIRVEEGGDICMWQPALCIAFICSSVEVLDLWMFS